MADKGTNPDSAAWAAALKHRPTYQKPLGEYFATYQVKERGLKKWIEESRIDWIAKGCKAGGPDFPPLDDPAKMLDWWLAHKKHAPSPELLALAGKTVEEKSAPAAREKKEHATTGEPTSAKRTAIDLASMDGVDLAGALAQQRKILAASLQEHAAALADETVAESTLTLRAKRVSDAMELLRTIEASLIKQQREAGDLVNLDDVRAELAPLLTNVALAFVEVLRDRLGLPHARARELADDCFRALASTRFGPPAAAAPVAA